MSRRLRSNSKADMDEVLEKLAKLDVVLKKLDLIDTKITNIDTRLVNMEAKLDYVTGRVTALEERADNSDLLIPQLKDAIRSNEISRINNEYNSRQYNMLLNNVPQDDINENERTLLPKCMRCFLGL